MTPNAEPAPKAGASPAQAAPKADAKPSAKPGAQPAPADDLKTLPLEAVEKKLESSPNGISQAEAAKRLTKYGPNEIAEVKTNPLLKFLTYFWGPIPWMIE
ncbi:MAG: cation-transporting P-type ATPase, partial [Gemmatimonadaceae bacterium]